MVTVCDVVSPAASSAADQECVRARGNQHLLKEIARVVQDLHRLAIDTHGRGHAIAIDRLACEHERLSGGQSRFADWIGHDQDRRLFESLGASFTVARVKTLLAKWSPALPVVLSTSRNVEPDIASATWYIVPVCR